jgi:hypothetical protein
MSNNEKTKWKGYIMTHLATVFPGLDILSAPDFEFEVAIGG